MKIAWVTYGLPWPANCGAALRDLHLLRRVASRHRVSLLAVLETPPDHEALAMASELCENVDWAVMRQERGLAKIRRWAHHLAAGHPLATWTYCPPVLAHKLAALIRREPIDILQIEHSFLAPFVSAVAGTGCRAVLDLHNHGEAQYKTMLRMQLDPLERWTWLVKAALMQGWEARLAARFDRCTAVSPVEARALTMAIGRPLDLVANGVDTTVLRPLPPPHGHRLLFVGNLRYPPNRDAVDWLAKDILPLVRREIADAELSVVGDRGGRPGDPAAGVTFLGQVDDILPCYGQAQIALAPLRAGGGTRLKILEAMALGRPVVATALGCEGLAVTPGQDILTGETPETLAAAIVRILRDDGLRGRIAERARALVERDYDWTKIGDRLLALYDRMTVLCRRM